MVDARGARTVRRFFLIGLILFLILPAAAQFTQISATVTDPNGLAYSNGTIVAKLVLPGGTSPTLNGLPYTPPSQPVGLNSNGFFLMQIADNTVLLPAATQWSFTVCSAAGTIQPAGGRGPVCFTVGPITISGTTQNLTTTLSSAAPALANPGAEGGVPPGVAIGSQLVSSGVGNSPSYQLKPVLDVRDVAGIDCTHTTDSSSAFQTWCSNRNNVELSIRSCQLRFDNPVTCSNDSDVTLIGDNYKGDVSAGTGASIAGCNGPASGTLLTFNRSGFCLLKNFGLYTRSAPAGCTSNFTTALAFTNSGVSGYTPTYNRVEGLGITTSTSGGAGPANFIGIDHNGTPNMEQIRVVDTWLHCQDSLNSFGMRQNGNNADDGLIRDSRIQHCFQGVRLQTGNLSIIHNHFDGTGNFSVYGVGGAAIYLGQYGSGPVNIWNNEESDGGPFINDNNDCTDTGGSNMPIGIVGNMIGTSDMSTHYAVQAACSNAQNFWIIGNRFLNTSGGLRALIGSDVGFGGVGPPGKITSFGNFVDVSIRTDPLLPPLVNRQNSTITAPEMTFAGTLQMVSVLFANLPTTQPDGRAVPDGSIIYCFDCNATCTAGASTGRTCFRENGAWTH